MELLGHENNHEIKLLWIDALARIGGPALDALLTTSMGDGDEEVRIACLERLQSAHYKPAVIYYIQSLKAKENSTVNLAAVGLFYMKDTTAISALIDALVTTHKQVIQPGGSPGQMSAGFGSGPGGNSGGSFNFGQPPPQVIKREHQNQDVLRALAMLSGVNYEYDVPAWKRWYTNQKKSSARSIPAATILDEFSPRRSSSRLSPPQSSRRTGALSRSRSALATTETELRLIAAAAIIGPSSKCFDKG